MSVPSPLAQGTMVHICNPALRRQRQKKDYKFEPGCATQQDPVSRKIRGQDVIQYETLAPHRKSPKSKPQHHTEKREKRKQ